VLSERASELVQHRSYTLTPIFKAPLHRIHDVERVLSSKPSGMALKGVQYDRVGWRHEHVHRTEMWHIRLRNLSENCVLVCYSLQVLRGQMFQQGDWRSTLGTGRRASLGRERELRIVGFYSGLIPSGKKSL
jgi:hypothetical protein